jgi:MSHA pilin protein MshC
MKFQPESLPALSKSARQDGAGQRFARGFTLIELIMVIVILGVLSVFAAPRIFNSHDFYARGFHDETLSMLRYAQKAAVAQRRTVCVSFSLTDPATAQLSIASTATLATCDAALAGPSKNCVTGSPAGSKGCINARAGVSYTAGPTGLNFNGLGQPVDALGVALSSNTLIQVSDVSRAIAVEAASGYVHD